MNDRIQELMKQANLQPYYDAQEKDIQKFAELIVRECIQLCDRVDLVGADDCIDNIREHFEIE